MNIKRLDKLAKEKAPMPSRLAMHEQCYYIASRGLYEQYASGLISLDTAKKEKEEVIKQYDLGRYQWELFMGLHDIEAKLRQLKKEGFNTALEMEILEQLEELLK